MSFSTGNSTSSIFPSGKIIPGSITAGTPNVPIQNIGSRMPSLETISIASTTAGNTPTLAFPSENANLETMASGISAYLERLTTPIPPSGKTGLKMVSDLLAKNPTAKCAGDAFIWAISAHLRAKEKFEKKEKVLKANKIHLKHATKHGVIPLETTFQENQTPGKLEMTVLAVKLGMDYKKVSNWFVKRRQAATREKEKMELERQALKESCDLLHAQFAVISYPFFFKVANNMPLDLPHSGMEKVAQYMHQCFTVPEFFHCVFQLPKDKPNGIDMEVESELAEFAMEDDVELVGHSQ